MPDYMIIHDSRQSLRVRADNPNEAVRYARDAPLDRWQLGDKDEIEVWPEGETDTVDFDWAAVEELAGNPISAEEI